MPVDRERSRTRRDFLGWSVGMPAALVAAGVLDDVTGAAAQVAPLPPTPACGDGGPATPSQTEGPYFKPSSPLRTSLLEPGVSGPRIVVEGAVRGTDCRPIPRALVDFWQADARGRYARLQKVDPISSDVVRHHIVPVIAEHINNAVIASAYLP